MAAKEDEELESLFDPRSIAVIGASRKEGKVGYTLFSNIIQSDYDGDVYPINPKGGEVLGREIYESIEEAPDPIDLAVIVVPAKGVKEVVHQCGEKGVKYAIV
ncbi:MAG: CoA-binding protein, partial [Candidatus Thermoplasmatota archaeon]|nr:CoA-binding protein [Candidatus Thermoplasmatota archaeon]